MKYLMDANIFIGSKNTFYKFNVCPGFWEWLSKTTVVASIDSVKYELFDGKDDLSEWVKNHLSDSFFIEQDIDIQKSYQEVVTYIQGLEQYEQPAKNDFFNVADGWLIAAARVLDCDIITHETFDPHIKRKIKIPNIANHYHINCLRIYDVLEKENVKFVLHTDT